MTAEATTQFEEKIGHSLAAQFVMTAVTLTLIGAFVLVQVRQGSGGGAASVAQGAQRTDMAETPAGAGPTRGRAASPIGPPDSGPRGGLAELHAERAPQKVTSPTVYIVGSEEQAQALRLQLQDHAAILDASSAPPADRRVLWFDSAEAETRFRLMTEEMNQIRNYEGLPPIHVIDRRGQ